MFFRTWNFNYTTRDVIWLAALGLVAGAVNTGLSLFWDAPTANQWPLVGAIAQGAFSWAYLLAFYLVRKPGSALIVGVLETSVQVLLEGPLGPHTLGWGLMQGAAVELLFALNSYRNSSVWLLLLAGAVATQARTLWTIFLLGWDPAFASQYWLTTPINLLSGALFSGLLSYGVGRGLLQAGLTQSPTPLP